MIPQAYNSASVIFCLYPSEFDMDISASTTDLLPEPKDGVLEPSDFLGADRLEKKDFKEELDSKYWNSLHVFIFHSLFTESQRRELFCSKSYLQIGWSNLGLIQQSGRTEDATRRWRATGGAGSLQSSLLCVASHQDPCQRKSGIAFIFHLNVSTEDIKIRANHSVDEEYLGDVSEKAWSDDPVINAAFERFNGRLKELEGTIDGRNLDPNLKNRTGAGVVHYELLKPFSKPWVTGNGVPYIISI
ncbi:hypothetical protein NE237_002867 [Protea cynaroides]|uniref:Lipoxygenase domain-containing protein n=1 Tax=Protea cynaroides TaxID=273540 RepID=A0A9Q0KFM4_9MAGN|nr:hypothetical protein NE237_002867 [Protea cynaroides]